jgi:hypothetical protein
MYIPDKLPDKFAMHIEIQMLVRIGVVIVALWTCRPVGVVKPYSTINTQCSTVVAAICMAPEHVKHVRHTASLVCAPERACVWNGYAA